MRHYCSLWDSKYLPQGLVLYESLKRHSSEPFTLWVLPMDDLCATALDDLHLEYMITRSRQRLEADMGISGAEFKGRFSWREWCWLSASQFTEHLMTDPVTRKVFTIPEITYLDADTMFFSDPAPVFAEIGSRSIAVTPHRLIPSKQHLAINGQFNVGWVTFKNDAIGAECAATWARQCRERCSEREGCGDQKYLDSWVGKYGKDLCIIENIGVNAGPWSIGNWAITEGPKLDGVPLVLYHYHELAAREDGTFRLTNYELRDEDIQLIYQPYLAAYRRARELLESSVV